LVTREASFEPTGVRAPRSRAQEFIPSTVTARCFSNHPSASTKIIISIKIQERTREELLAVSLLRLELLVVGGQFHDALTA
jgi:hypothetical protein